MADEKKAEDETKKKIKIRKLQQITGSKVEDLDKLQQLHQEK